MTNEEMEQKKHETIGKTSALFEEVKEARGKAFSAMYQKAIDFIDQGEYNNALDAAKMIESVLGYKKQAKMLEFRVFTTCAETFSEEDIESLISIWSAAASCCDSYEEFFSIYNDAILYLRNWLKTVTHRLFVQERDLMEQVTIHDFPFGKVTRQFSDNNSIYNEIINKMLRVPVFGALVEKSDMSIDEARDRYLIKRPSTTNIFLDESYKASCRIFDEITAFVEENKYCSVEYVDEIIEKVWFWSSVASIHLHSIGTNSAWDKENRSRALKKNIDFCNYYLNALIYPNGRTVSLAFYPKYRELYLNRLEEEYTTILELEPDFEVATLPDREPVNESVQNNSSSGCYVATAVYGSYDCPQVWTLRRFRDDILSKTWCGRAFIRTYYAISPTLVKWFGKTAWFKNLWKPMLECMVKRLNASGVENTPYKDTQW